jgi:large subunit ribosomal protein L10
LSEKAKKILQGGLFYGSVYFLAIKLEAIMLGLSEKKQHVLMLEKLVSGCISVVLFDYAGLSVGQIEGLRHQARLKKVLVKVMKNTLIRRAFEGSDFESAIEKVKGPVMLLLSQDAPGDGAKVLSAFIKSNKLSQQAVALVVGRELFEGSLLSKVASLPTKQEAIAQLAVVLKAPQTKFALTLKQIYTKSALVLKAVSDKK